MLYYCICFHLLPCLQIYKRRITMEKKYQIELTETQLHLIAECVEDCHRFMAGQTDLWHCVSRLDCYYELKDGLAKLQPFVTPDLPFNASYGWSGEKCPNKEQRKFIAQTYPIYREILHFFACQKSGNEWNVYNSDTLTCTEGGEPIKIKIKKE